MDSAGGEMQVARRGFQILVTEQGLNHQQTGTVFEQVRGEGVA